VLVLNIKYAKLHIFKNTWEFWSPVFVGSEWIWDCTCLQQCRKSPRSPASVGLRLCRSGGAKPAGAEEQALPWVLQCKCIDEGTLKTLVWKAGRNQACRPALSLADSAY